MPNDVRQPLHNRYFGMRHGQSHPNVAGVIISGPADGVAPANGLTDLGRQQARRSGLAWARSHPRPMIISSDFSRARETAEELRAVTDTGPVRIDVRLRERDFGPYDGGPVAGYQEVWRADAAGEEAPGVEPAESVLARMLSLIGELERDQAGRDIVLVSHGDTLQITAAHFAGLPPHRHRSFEGLTNAEIRPLSAGG